MNLSNISLYGLGENLLTLLFEIITIRFIRFS